MKRMFASSLIIKLSVLVILIESLVLVSIGIYYHDRFEEEIDKRIESQINIPGILMNHQLLRYEAISDRDMIAELVGEELVDGLVIGADQKIFYALNAADEGKNVAAIPDFDPRWLDSTPSASMTFHLPSQDGAFLASITPLRAYAGAGPFFFVYLKVNTSRSEAQKTTITWLFLLGSMFCVLSTSAGLIISLKIIVTSPLSRLEENARQITQGNLHQPIEIRRQDELGALASCFRQMRDAIRQKLGQLEDLNQTLEQKVKERTYELDERVKELNCLYTMSHLVEESGISFEEIFQRTVEIIPSSWQYPEMTCARIVAEGQEFRTENFRETDWKQISHIVVQGKYVGKVEICYLEKKPEKDEGPFLEEERHLINAIAEQSGRIIEYKRAETALHDAKEAAEAANRAKSVFLANMSHELRSPLNAVLGFTQVMARSSTLPPEHREHLNIIRRSGEHLLTLINQVLDLSKIEAGRITLNARDFDLHHLLHDVQDMFALRAETKGLHLLFEKDASVPQYIHTDDVKLRQVLINLLNNAVKFTEKGGVTVRILDLGFEILDLQDAHFQASQQKSKIKNLKFEIEDTGPGIAPEEIDAVFEPFKQTDTGRQSQEGTGLGLPISRKFVQLMGGDIKVTSQLGRGATFTFDIQCELADTIAIPLSTPINRVVALEPGQRPADGSERYRLLIVDDKPDNRRLLSALLAPFGFELQEATNGQEAIDIWEKWKPHLIWMDMRMPVLDGYEATQKIRAAEAARAKEQQSKKAEDGHRGGSEKSQITNHKSKIVIIAVTASAYEEERAEVLSAGCDDFLRKPFTDAEIFEMLHKHLGVRFVDEDETQVADRRSQVAGKEGLTPMALSGLPAEILADLKQGAEDVDVELLFSAIEHIRTRNAELADALAQLVKDFEYDEVLQRIQDTQ